MKKIFGILSCCLMISAVATATFNPGEIQAKHEKTARAEQMRAQKKKGETTFVAKLLKRAQINEWDEKPGGCTIGGGRCSFDSDCCSENCYAGTCQAGAGGCSIGGSSCSFDSDCCSENCYAGTCQDGSSCTNGGGSCSFDSDCCSDNCYAGVCQASCSTEGSSCTYDSECCAGNCNRQGYCGAEDPNCRSW